MSPKAYLQAALSVTRTKERALRRICRHRPAYFLVYASRVVRILFGLILLLAAINSAAAEEPPKFVVGVSLALSGPFAEYGVAVQHGIELARSENPAALAPIDFIFEDDGYEPKRTVGAISKLRDIDGASLLFVWGNEPALGAAPVAERLKIPTLVVAQHPQAGAGYHYVIRFINPAEEFSLALLKYLRTQPSYASSPKPRRFEVVKAEISFFNILLDEFGKGLTAEESISIVDTYTAKDTDFRPTILKLKSRKADNLGVYLVPPQIEPFFRQAAELDFHPHVFGASPFESSIVIKSALGSMEGAVFSHISALPEFQRRYEQRFGDDVQVAYAAQAYDFAMLCAELFGGADNRRDADSIITALTSIGRRSGSLGSYRLRKDTPSGTYFEFPVAVKKIENGRIITVQTVEPGLAP